MPETLELETRVTRLEEESREVSSAASSHFLELRAFFQDGMRSLARQLNGFSQQVATQLARVDRRFAQIDRRFAQIDRRFAQIDRRFDRLEAKLDRFIRTQRAINRRVERRRRRLERRNA